jgi:siroheme synthase-like protein
MDSTTTTTNTLYPVFLKLYQLRLLIVGGGNVGEEKLYFILKNSPDAQITVVSDWFKPETLALANTSARVQAVHRAFQEEDLEGHDLVLLATNNRATNRWIRGLAKARGLLVNVADTPDLCDFYLGSIVTRGPLKVGISTNGQSPTLAKRIRELLEAMLPDEVGELTARLKTLRDGMAGDFQQKVRQLNELTQSLVGDTPDRAASSQPPQSEG